MLSDNLSFDIPQIYRSPDSLSKLEIQQYSLTIESKTGTDIYNKKPHLV